MKLSKEIYLVDKWDWFMLIYIYNFIGGIMDMKKIISILLTLAMLVGISTAALAVDTPNKSYPQRFYDVPKDHWAFSYIAELVARGVLEGYDDGSFKPEGTVSRAEFAKIMVGAAGVQTNDNSVYFSDMQNHWAIPYVNAAKDYLTAYADNTYRPNQAAVREDVTMAMVKLKGYDVSSADFSYLADFTDNNSISNNVKKYVAVAVEKGLISGFEDNTFRGQATLTRAEAATLLWRAFQYGSDNKVVDSNTTPLEPVASKPITVATPPATQIEPIQIQATPTPTSEPTPEPTEKPYKVDTLVKADVSDNEYLYTADSNYLYYAEDDKIIKVNIKSKDKVEILDTKDLTIDTDEYTLSDFDICSICYDKYNNRLLVQGRYLKTNSAVKINTNYLYEIKENNITVITNNYPIDNYWSYLLTGTLSNGDYVTKGAILDCDSFDEKKFGGELLASEEADDRLYYFAYDVPYGDGGHYKLALCEYDFSRSSVIWNGLKGVYGLSDKSFMTLSQDNSGWYIYLYNLNGKKLNEITDIDVLVADRTALIWDNTLNKFLISDNIIFYDTSAKAFRMISEI